ncbi:zinc finger and SCAN domain-containing protein 12-like [Engraulis encrasicolus]|uniref:zinc finger and SCAN domain-containing protein 12-like n=1 Tax=Engraulis encrasicolus TaxID=184585 RepID=UPI002FCF5741
MEREINSIFQHVDASHRQACSDVENASELITEALQMIAVYHIDTSHKQAWSEKASQIITETLQRTILQREIQRNTSLRVLIHRLEERVTENGRSQVASSQQLRLQADDIQKQLRLQVDDLQKQLRDKDKSLTQAKQRIGFLEKQLLNLQQRHQNSSRTIQEVTEWLQDGQSKPNVVEDGGTSEMAPNASSEISQPPPELPASTAKSLRLLKQVVDCLAVPDQQRTVDGETENGGKEKPMTGTGGASHLSSSAVPSTSSQKPTRGTAVTPFRCEQCGKYFKRVKFLKRHMVIHTGEKPYSCNRCGRRFPTEEHLESHKQLMHTEERSYRCTHCGKLFAKPRNLELHLHTHTGEKPYKCTQCDKSFSQPGNLKMHQFTHMEEKKPLRCDECGKRFVHPGGLTRHQLIHKKEKPHRCDQCDMRFTLPTHLKRHMLVHSEEKGHRCKECGKAFLRLDCLRRHLQTQSHTTEMPHRCTECGKSFAQLRSLRSHQKKYHAELDTEGDSK